MKDNKTDEKTYVVYCHTTPDGMQYFGMSGNVERRWFPCLYKGNKQFYDAIIKFGWKNIKHEVLYSGLTRDAALKIEDSLITDGWKSGTCLNMFRSGHFHQTDEFKEKEKARKKANKEYNKIYMREYRKRRGGNGDNK